MDKMWIQLSLYKIISRSYNRTPMLRIFVIILSLVGITSCSGDWTNYPASSPAHKTNSLIIRAGDILDVSVFDETKISNSYQVSQSGTINLPLIGMVNIVGQNTQSAEKIIATSLKQKGYFIDPKVTITFVQDHKIYILGEVLESGEFDYRPGMTILDLVAKARGFSYRANQNDFDIIRQKIDGSETHIKGDIATRLMPNDTIRVRERYF